MFGQPVPQRLVKQRRFEVGLFVDWWFIHVYSVNSFVVFVLKMSLGVFSRWSIDSNFGIVVYNPVTKQFANHMAHLSIPLGSLLMVLMGNPIPRSY